jgi:two-component system C4-dicarboxylate transport response regulator DctD
MTPHRLKRVVVVLVDDEPGVRSAMKMLLEAVGFQVEAYASANEALSSRFCRDAGTPDGGSSAVIVSDVRMPGLDGFEFLSALRRSGVTTPLVLVSGHATKDELSRGLALGAQGFLSKPYDPADLCALINELAAAGREREEAVG